MREGKVALSLLIFVIHLTQGMNISKKSLVRTTAASMVLSFGFSLEPSNVLAAPRAMHRQCGNLDLDLEFIGSGGSGTVFRGDMKGRKPVVVKVSRKASENSVKREAAILIKLEQKLVNNVERFVDSCDMDIGEGATYFAGVFRPYLNPPEASSIATIKNDATGAIKAKASRQLMRTVIEMVNADIALTDLQVLIEPDTGQLLVIDLTEAETLRLEQGLSFHDKAVVSSFFGEALAFVEEAMTNAPNKQIRDSIRDAALDGVKEGIAVTSLSESALGLVDVLTSGLR
jgi:hypothetical protein